MFSASYSILDANLASKSQTKKNVPDHIGSYTKHFDSNSCVYSCSLHIYMKHFSVASPQLYQKFIDILNEVRELNKYYVKEFEEMGFDLELVAITRLNRWDDGCDDVRVLAVLRFREDGEKCPLDRDSIYEESLILTPAVMVEPLETLLTDWIKRVSS